MVVNVLEHTAVHLSMRTRVHTDKYIEWLVEPEKKSFFLLFIIVILYYFSCLDFWLFLPSLHPVNQTSRCLVG